MHQPRSSHLRIGRYSETNRIYMVTTRCKGRRCIFDSDRAARIVIAEIRQRELEKVCENLSFVVMPDHIHWLFQLHADGELGKIVARTKGRAAFRINRALRRSGTLWQDGFHDHAARREEVLENLANYIIHNPVRAGIVSSPHDYPHWWSRWHPRGDAQC